MKRPSRTQLIVGVIAALVAVLLWNLVADPVEDAIFNGAPPVQDVQVQLVSAEADAQRCPLDDPCSVNSTREWQSRYRAGKLGDSGGEMLPLDVRMAVKRAWAKRYNARHRSVTTDARAQIVSRTMRPSDYCSVTREVNPFLRKGICNPFRMSGTGCFLIANKTCDGNVDDWSWRAASRVAFDCGTDVFFGALGGALGGPTVAFVGAGLGAAHCAVDRAAEHNNWW